METYNRLNSIDFWSTYHELFFTKERQKIADNDIKNIEVLIGDFPVAILDICCGVGFHAIGLARKKHKVTGVDFCPKLIQMAKQKVINKDLQIEFLCKNINQINEVEQYDVILWLWNSFGYMNTPQENQAILKIVYNALKLNGVFILDTVNKNYFQKLLKISLKKIKGHTIKKTYCRVDDYLESNWIISKTDNLQKVYLRQNLYDRSSLNDILIDIGFSQVQFYSSLNMLPFSNGKKLVVVATKVH